MSIEIAKPEVEIAAAIRELVKQQPEKCTIVHCRYAIESGSMYRIWPETFLIENDGSRRRLIKAFNITLMPHWTLYFAEVGVVRFTLIFEGLSRNCSSFTLLEEIPEPGGFYSDVVGRNNSDVYEAAVHSD